MMIDTILGQAQDLIALAPTPGPGEPNAPTGPAIDTQGIITFLTRWIAPILLAILGLIFMGRAPRGEVSKVITSSGIAVVGICFLAGAVLLPIFGGTLVDMIFSGE